MEGFIEYYKGNPVAGLEPLSISVNEVTDLLAQNLKFQQKFTGTVENIGKSLVIEKAEAHVIYRYVLEATVEPKNQIGTRITETKCFTTASEYIKIHLLENEDCFKYIADKVTNIDEENWNCDPIDFHPEQIVMSMATRYLETLKQNVNNTKRVIQIHQKVGIIPLIRLDYKYYRTNAKCVMFGKSMQFPDPDIEQKFISVCCPGCPMFL